MDSVRPAPLEASDQRANLDQMATTVAQAARDALEKPGHRVLQAPVVTLVLLRARVRRVLQASELA